MGCGCQEYLALPVDNVVSIILRNLPPRGQFTTRQFGHVVSFRGPQTALPPWWHKASMHVIPTRSPWAPSQTRQIANLWLRYFLCDKTGCVRQRHLSSTQPIVHLLHF